jgi:hypothetical protein
MTVRAKEDDQFSLKAQLAGGFILDRIFPVNQFVHLYAAPPAAQVTARPFPPAAGSDAVGFGVGSHGFIRRWNCTPAR